MKQIPYLHQGSKIAIAAPARMVTPEEMQFAINWLKEKGFVPVYDDRLFAQHYIFAGDDDFRAAVFQEYLDNEDIEAIWLARGGYGSIRIIDKLDFTKFLQHPKWIVGFSEERCFTANSVDWAFPVYMLPCLSISKTRPQRPNMPCLTRF